MTVLSLVASDAPLVFVTAVVALLVLWAVAVYLVEVHRTGSHPWAEYHNDRVVPLYRRRRHVVPVKATVMPPPPHREAGPKAA